MASSKLVDLSAKIGQYFPNGKNGDGQPGVVDVTDYQPKTAAPNGTSSPPTGNHVVRRLPDEGLTSLSRPDQVKSLFGSVQTQALDLQGQLAKATSDWTSALSLLTGRVATLEPLLADALKTSTDRERAVDELAATNKEIKQKLVDSDRDLLHYRPLALQLGEDLRIAKSQLEKSARRIHEIETENARAISEYNDLYRKLATADTVNQRLTEENHGYSQKLGESDTAIQSLLRNTAQLRSDLVSASAERERAETERNDFADRLKVANEEINKSQLNLDSIMQQMFTLKKESSARIKETEERERQALENLIAKDKQLYDLDAKLAGMNSKNEFLERMIQRMREELRRHLDHIGTLESSNRQLLEALSRNSEATDLEGDLAERQQTQRGTPRLRTVHE